MKIVMVADCELSRAFPVMHQLRPHLTEREFSKRVARQRVGGFDLAGVEHRGKIVGLVGFRIFETLAWGKILYVDDLVTDGRHRSQGVGRFLINWLKKKAKSHDCDEFHLDSGVQRFAAHRFYLRERMEITCHHFALKLK